MPWLDCNVHVNLDQLQHSLIHEPRAKKVKVVPMTDLQASRSLANFEAQPIARIPKSGTKRAATTPPSHLSFQLGPRLAAKFPKLAAPAVGPHASPTPSPQPNASFNSGDSVRTNGGISETDADISELGNLAVTANEVGENRQSAVVAGAGDSEFANSSGSVLAAASELTRGVST